MKQNQITTVCGESKVYQAYYLHDLNSDGIPELLLKLGDCHANYHGVAYTYDKSKQKAVKARNFLMSHATLYYGNSSKSAGPLRSDWFHMGSYTQYRLTLGGMTLKQTEVLVKRNVSEKDIPSHYGKLTEYSTRNLSPLS